MLKRRATAKKFSPLLGDSFNHQGLVNDGRETEICVGVDGSLKSKLIKVRVAFGNVLFQ